MKKAGLPEPVGRVSGPWVVSPAVSRRIGEHSATSKLRRAGGAPVDDAERMLAFGSSGLRREPAHVLQGNPE